MKEAVTKVIDTLTQEDFHGAFLLYTDLRPRPEIALASLPDNMGQG